jgi:DNA ligase-1
MLAQKVADVTDAFEHVKKPAMIEYKYDGFRVQIHKTKDNISLFTRKLESVTAAFPDVVQAIQQHVTADSCILDAEIVGYDPAKKTYLPFQQISSRIRRKYDISQNQKTTPVEVNVFDIIMLNQENLLNTPFGERRKLLQTYIEQKTLVCVISKGIITEDENAAKSFYAAALAAGLEGVMCKALDAPYKPGSRVGFMVKLKPTMDTLDVVVTAATWGEGKRANVLTSFTISCIDDDGNFLELGNVGTGFKELEKEVKPTDTTTQPEEENTDVTFSTMTKLLEPNVIKTDGRNVIVKPTVVLEVAYEEIQKSQNYSSGFALRFPRVVRLQNTRSADSISTLALVEEFYYGQAKRQ